MLGLRRLTEPTQEIVSLELARLHCRVDQEEEDALLEIYIAAACEQVEGLTGRLLRTQTWEMTLDVPDLGRRIILPLAPIQAILSVSTLGDDGTETALTSGQYRASATSGTIEPVDLWPERRLVVTARVGYGQADQVPPTLQAAILLGLGDLYEHREAGTERALTSNPAFMRLINMHRMIGV